MCGTSTTPDEEEKETRRGPGWEARKKEAHKRAAADLFFLLGLLLGGPLMGLAGRIQLGLFIVLAGGLASVLRRYGMSSGGSLLAGPLLALIAASLVMGPPWEEPGPDPDSADLTAAREAYVAGLARNAEEGRIEARGPGSSVVWYFLPEAPEGESRECGTVPDRAVREHLAAVGVRRVVVTDPGTAGALCTFRP